MNKLIVAGAIIGSTILVGCMSLEERLASNDANIRRQAEYELVQRAYRSGTQADRLAAIAKVSDQDLLFGLAMKSQENTAKEGAAAVQKLTDANRALQVAKGSSVAEVSKAALAKVTDPSAYADIAQGAKASAVRLDAYEKITDQNQLLSIAQATKDKAIKLSAIKRVNDKEKLLPIVFASTATARPAAQPVKHNPDVEKRMMAEKMGLEKKMMAEKMSKKQKGGHNKQKVEASGATTGSSLDTELIDAFIDNCAQDSVLIKMVKTYGDQLSSEQCEKLKTKSQNKDLMSSIAAIADVKVANSLREKLMPDINGNRIGADEFLSFYKTIQDKDVRGQLFCDEIDLISGLYSNSKSWNEIISLTTDEWIVKAIKCANHISNKEDIVYHVQSNRVPKLLCLVKDEYSEVYTGLIRMIKNQEDLVAVLKTAPENILANEISVLDDQMTYTIKSISPETAELFLSHNFVQYIEDKDDKKKTIRIMARQMLKVSTAEKKRVLDEAQKNLANHHKDVCVGPFYIGMPYYEATIVAEAQGLYGKKKDEVTLYFDNENPDEIMKDWKHNLKVQKISFTTKGALKYLNCEDALVLQQTIKQCVKKESGKARAFDYAGEIKHDVKVDSSTRINLFSPTGTSTDYTSEIWASYTNARQGVKLMYGEKSGTLILEAME